MAEHTAIHTLVGGPGCGESGVGAVRFLRNLISFLVSCSPASESTGRSSTVTVDGVLSTSCGSTRAWSCDADTESCDLDAESCDIDVEVVDVSLRPRLAVLGVFVGGGLTDGGIIVVTLCACIGVMCAPLTSCLVLIP